ncbi:MAG TPA: CHAP domain-containing protein [Acidiphilium sp.]
MDDRHTYARHLNERHSSHLHHYIRRSAYLWCVPYARDVSHIDLKGDAFLWWAEAAGRYARGSRPAVGSVLNFRSSGRIPLGHVAVVAKVINSREILVDQANWVPDTVTRDVPVVDVSRDNNWSAVQVSIGGGRFGTTYPTYGFIYDQAPGNVIYARNASGTEVAEAPAPHVIRLNAPNRTLR